jgi:cyanophycin synthetase
MNIKITQNMKFIKGPSAWFKHQVCTFTLDAEQIKHPDDSRLSLLKELALPLPANSTSLGLWLAQLANALQKFASYQGDFFSYRVLTSKNVSENSLVIAFAYLEEEVARDSLLCALYLAQVSTHLPCDNSAEIPNHIRKLGHKVGLGPSTYAIWEAALEQQVPVWKLSDCSLLQLGLGKQQQRVWTAETGQTPLLAENIAQDKDWTRQLLETVGVPVPQGRVVVSREDAWVAAQEIGLPVVVKPQFGSQGNGVSINLHSEQQVLDAFDNANAFKCSVVTESFKEGADYRILVIGEKMIAASLREPAQVIGDGVSTIAQLVAAVNRDPRRAESHAGVLSPIPLDPISLAVLASQGLALDSIPDKGNKVLIRKNANLSTGGTAKDVTDLVHPQVATLAISAARQLGLDISGVDIITSDISKPLAETNGAVVEVNAGPGLRMHLEPSEGQGRPVGKAIVSMLFPKPAKALIPVIAIISTKGVSSIMQSVFRKAQQCFGATGLIGTDGLFVDAIKIAKRSECAGVDVLRLCQHPDLKALVVEFSWDEFAFHGLGLSCYSLIVCADTPESELFPKSELLQQLRHGLSPSGKILLPENLAGLAPAQPTFWSKALLYCTSPWNECLKYLALNPSGIIQIHEDKLSFYRGEIKESERTLAYIQTSGLNLVAVVEHLLEQIVE